MNVMTRALIPWMVIGAVQVLLACGPGYRAVQWTHDAAEASSCDSLGEIVGVDKGPENNHEAVALRKATLKLGGNLVVIDTVETSERTTTVSEPTPQPGGDNRGHFQLEKHYEHWMRGTAYRCESTP